MIGSTPDAERARAVGRFQDDPTALYLVANEGVLQRGVTLTSAQDAYYFEPGWSAMMRQQTEDRQHRIGQVGTVLYTDILSENMIDRKVRRINQEAINLADMIMGQGWKGLFETI
jgi:SNF2 family DNA or RNA helicase